MHGFLSPYESLHQVASQSIQPFFAQLTDVLNPPTDRQTDHAVWYLCGLSLTHQQTARHTDHAVWYLCGLIIIILIIVVTRTIVTLIWTCLMHTKLAVTNKWFVGAGWNVWWQAIDLAVGGVWLTSVMALYTMFELLALSVVRFYCDYRLEVPVMQILYRAEEWSSCVQL